VTAIVFEEAAGVYRLPVHTPFPVGPINVYLLEGERPVLFDTGLKAERTWDELVDGLASLGRRPEDIVTVIVSHAHIDHQGLADRFERARVLTGEADLEAVRDVRGHIQGQQPVLISFLDEWQVPPEEKASIEEALKLWRWAASSPRAEAVPDGAVIDGVPGDVTALAMPGHTRGLTCLLRREDGLLFSSDLLLPTITPNPAVYTDVQPPRTGLPDYLASLRRLLTLDARRVLPGHGEPFDFAASKIEDLLAHHERRLAEILGAVDAPASVFTIAERLFSGLDPLNLFLALREVYGHLEILRERGSLGVHHRSGVACYRRT
jgi:glyoxylase-like metal-dependent hydrolase (beta-lactamase superfamily II)